MKKEYFHYFLHSISLKLLSLILLTVVPIVLLLIYNNNRSRDTLLKQVEDTHYNMLRTYMDQLDYQLNAALSYSLNLVINENDPQIITLSNEEASIQYAKLHVRTDMEENLLSNNFLNGYFLYAREQDGFVDFIHSSNLKQPPSGRNICSPASSPICRKTAELRNGSSVPLRKTIICF